MGVNDFKLSLMLTLQLEICQRTEQKEVCLFKSLGWIFQDQLHTEQKVTKMERHISFCSHSSLTRVVYLELLSNQTMEEFIRSLKQLITKGSKSNKNQLL